MDDPLIDSPVPVVPLAAAIQFAAGESFGFPAVESRFVLLCRAGRGQVWVNGQQFDIGQGDGLVLPWRHDIHYAADVHDPYSIVGAHVVPEHDREHPVVATVPHRPNDILSNCSWRRDGGPVPTRSRVFRISAGEHPGLARMAVHSAHVVERRRPDATTMQALGVLMLREIGELVRPTQTVYGQVSDELSRALRYVDRQIGRRLTVAELAEVAGCSPATLSRRFRTELDTTPLTWVTARRVEHAQRWLRTTRLTVAQVAARCGVADPYYFSRLFRRHTGQPPSAWRHHAMT